MTQGSEKSSANTPDNLPALVWLLLTTRKGWIGIAGMIAVLTAVTLIAIRFMRPEKIEISANSGTITLKTRNTQNALLSLSPNGGDDGKPWVGTGIEVKKGDVIKITASGRVNTAIKRVVAQTFSPEVEPPIWVSPRGIQINIDDTDLNKNNKKNTVFPLLHTLKLLPDKDPKNIKYPFGMLLATVRNRKGQISDIVPFEPEEKNGDFFEFKTENDGELMLTVNDILLSNDPKVKNLYVPEINKDSTSYYLQLAEFEAAFKGENFKAWSKETKSKKVSEQHEIRKRGWKSIVERNIWNIWYADNIGSFSVSITVNE